MSSRPPMGVPQRQPPSRSLSGSSSLSQRPAHQRTLSSQYIPSSPIRNNNNNSTTSNSNISADFAADSSSQNSNATQTQYGTPRRGGSRLRLELSNQGITHSGFIESPTSAGALDPFKSFAPSRPAAPSMSGDVSDLGDMSSPQTSRGAPTADNDNNPLPMPRRRTRFVVPDVKKDVAAPAPAPVKKDIRPKPYTVEVPPAAPRYLVLNGSGKADSSSRAGASTAPPTAHADFNPWTGDGPEDHFTQTFIQTGFFDKAPVAQAETSSAKGAIFPSLKHKSGLYALSTVFTGILGSRRHNGQINSASTFKPPPRVTVTDTKREAWLKDLANPTTSLRRLSRTIPHGIRGKGLLEQCLNKNIPTDRAVWLAKCVGANEVRAFKRKGVNGAVVMGGEAKWVRDWTMFVEQFVDGVVSSFEDAEWKAKVNYALRLATHLYAEHLLDREHYMEWLVSGLENCSQAKLPMWLLVTQIYWKDLLRLRKYGRRLVAALLNQNTTIQNHPDHDILAPLSSRIAILLKTLMISSATNFISPSTWAKHRDTLSSVLPADDEMVQAAYRGIHARNEQLVSSVRAPPATRHVMVKMLDGTLQTPMPDDLPTKCWNMSVDQSTLARTTLEWCTSLYRPGVARVYVTCRLLSTWMTFGLDTTAAVLEFMNSDPLEELERKTSLYHLVSELVHSGSFDPLIYVQWLIARGGLHDSDSVMRDGPASSRLLVELPLHALSPSLSSMRANMLGRASYSVEDEAKDQEMAINCIKSSLGLHWNPAPKSSAIPLGKLCKRVSLSSRSLKTEIGQFIRRTYVHGMVQGQLAGKESLQLPVTTFNGVRSVLEAAEDFQTLADLLKTTTGFYDADILSSSADTLNLHLPVFGALNVAKGLFDTLLGRLENIKQIQGLAGTRPLLTSMAILAPRIPGQEALVSYLNETIRNDRSSAVDASSPVSDNMAARIQDEEGELLDEIEKRLANKTSMDRTTMNSFLNKIIPKVQACWGTVDERLRAYSSLLTRLRHFDVQHFDSFMTKWVLGIRNPQTRPSLSRIFPLMISVGCLNLSIILTTTGDAASATGSPYPAGKTSGPLSTYVQEVLEMLTMPASKELLTPEEIYRFKILQNQAPKSHLKELVALVRNALTEFCTFQARGGSETAPLADSRAQGRLLCFLRTLVLSDQAVVPKLLPMKTADPAVVQMMDDITTRLLLPHASEGTQITFDQVLGLANELTLPFCQLKLSQGFGSTDTSSATAQDRQANQLEIFTKAMDNAIDARNITWTGMLPTLSPEITQHLLNRAQTRFFDLLPSKERPQPPPGSVAAAESLLSVIDTIGRGGLMGSRSPLQLASATVDRLADLWELLALPSESDVKVTILVNWLPLMLSYLTLQAHVHDAANKACNEVRGRALLVLSGIIQELDGLVSLSTCDPRVPSNQAVYLIHRVFDLALILVDNLSEEIRQQCVRVLKEALSDSRLKYIFSSTPAPLENFMLSHKDKPATPQQPQSQGSQGSQQAQQQRPRGAGFLGVGAAGGNIWGNAVGPGGQGQEKLSAFTFKRWEILNEPTSNVGENNTSLSLTLFEAIKLH
ncbi:transcription mediator subunit Med12 [Diaporthe amygdali]|uniref:transcription mediator subunit Med12 n=1 Tax=Phomopsis amygdali TaxID=1214568 RepID=UPI0022FE3FCF|nr:transcription mediator subunit Med12 [Diaporthe amygdali]KAJ0123071.1 transcription mediator subunit Med12 [Diaporthe amygdali]